MDYVTATIGRTIEAVRPGRLGDVGAGSYPGGIVSTAGLNGPQGQYVTYSGTTPTVHTVLQFGTSGHGFGAELV